MGYWRIDSDALAGSRFVVSALAETTAALMALHRKTATHPAERAWLADRHPPYRAHLAADPVAAHLVRAALGRLWIADHLTPPPDGRPFEEELESIRATPDAAVRTYLRAASGALPGDLDRARGLGPRTAELLEWVWTEAVRPDWERRRRVAEADILLRTAQLSRGGWAAALSGMRPDMAWLGEGRLRINLQDRPPRELSGAAGLVFVPVTPPHGWVAWRGAHRHALVYPAEGQLAQPAAAAPQALVRLLGPVRARVLVLLASPKSTTQLVALTGLSLGAVAGQLKVLLDAGLILRRRAGRTVLYGRVAAGDVLVSAATGSAPV